MKKLLLLLLFLFFAGCTKGQVSIYSQQTYIDKTSFLKYKETVVKEVVNSKIGILITDKEVITIKGSKRYHMSIIKKEYSEGFGGFLIIAKDETTEFFIAYRNDGCMVIPKVGTDIIIFTKTNKKEENTWERFY